MAALPGQSLARAARVDKKATPAES